MASILETILQSPDAAAGLVTGGMNVLGSGLSTLVNYGMMKDQQAYNSPQNQMEMMKAAGINPNAAAQGISGSGAQSGLANAVAPQMPNLGQLVGQSAQRDLNAPMIEAMTHYYESLKTGQDNDNVVTGDSSVIEARKASYTADLRKRMADASISEANATIIEAEAEYAGENAYNNALILQQKHANMVKEYEEIQSKIKANDAQAAASYSEVGLNEAQARKADADAVEKEWFNKYRDENGYDKDDPLWIKYEELMKAGKYDQAEQLLKDSCTALKTEAEGKAAGNFEGSHPANKAFADVAEYRNELKTRQDDLYEVKRQLYEKFKNKEIDFKQYQESVLILQDQIKDVGNKLSNADKDYRKGLYITGKPTFWQDMAQQLPNLVGDIIGSVTGVAVAGKVAGAAAGKAAGNVKHTIPTYHNVNWQNKSPYYGQE